MSIPLDASQYEIIRDIGNTKYSSISMVRCITNDQLFAMEKIDLEKTPFPIETLHQEISYWSSLSHANMLKYYGSFVEQNTLYILSEMISDGNLLDILNFKYSEGIKDEALIATILQGVLLFLSYYHQNHHVHRRLETNNILVTQKGNVKVAGFWNARSLIEQGKLQNVRSSIINTSCYSAPEIIVKGTGYNQSADIWSLGIIAIELALGKAPYSNLEPLRQIKAIIDDDPPNLPIETSKTPIFSSAFRDFISQCLRKSYQKRPTASELLKHKFFTHAKDNNYIYINLIAHIPPLAYRLNQKFRSESVELFTEDKLDRFNASCPSISSFDFCGFDTSPTENHGNHSFSTEFQGKSTPRRYSNPSKKSQITDFEKNEKKFPEMPIKVVKKGRFTFSIPMKPENEQ